MKRVCFLAFLFLFYSVSVMAQPNTITLPKVVVTASRIKEKQTASSVTVITAKELKSQGISNVVDALKEIPGVVITQNGFGGTASVFVRGADNGQAVIMIDGVPVYDPSGIKKGDFSDFLPHLSVSEIDRIEVVRGPQSVLYGSNAMAGVINIITKKGKGKPQTSLIFEGGSYNTFKETLNFSGSNQSTSYNLTVGRFDSSGFSKTPDDPDKDGYRANRIQASLNTKLNDQITLGSSFLYTEAEQGLDSGETFETDRLGFTQVHLTQRILKNWRHTLKFSYTNTHRHYRPESFYDGDLYFLSWQHDFKLTPYLKLISGFDYQQERANSTSLKTKKTQDEKAWFLEGIFDWKQIYFNAGVRYDRHQTAGDKVTYRLAGAYFLPTQTKLHASFGTGFRAPSLYQLFNTSSGNPNLRPERSQGYDVGLTQYLLEEKIAFDATYFFNWFKDMIDWKWTGPGKWDGKYFNVKKAHTQGIELTLNMRPVDYLTFKLFYTWLNAKNVVTHTWLLKRPHHRGGFEITYLLPKSKGAISFGGLYNDKAYGYGHKLISSYFVAHLAAQYRLSSRITLLARLNNLFNAQYQECYGYNTPDFNAYGGVEIKW